MKSDNSYNIQNRCIRFLSLCYFCLMMLSVYVVFFFFLYNQTDDCVLRNFKYINVGYISEKLWHSGGGLITIYYDIEIDCSDI